MSEKYCDDLSRDFEYAWINLSATYNLYNEENKLNTPAANIHLGMLRLRTHRIIEELSRKCPGRFIKEAERLEMTPK